jgi:hypothetical protein
VAEPEFLRLPRPSAPFGSANRRRASADAIREQQQRQQQQQ